MANSTKNKIILNYKKLKKTIDAHRVLGKKIICTIGSWDMLHIGHLRYLNKAKEIGDVLIVGTDSDRAIKIYKKNPLRPVIPEDERMEMLSYQTFVDYVTIVNDVDKKGRWQLELVKFLKPDVFVVSDKESYPREQRKQIIRFCGKIKVLGRQAQHTSTTAIIEKTFKKRLEHLLNNAKL